ncbi:MAG: TatD family hydrolase [Candidatus Woesearchaeota archaeon]
MIIDVHIHLDHELYKNDIDNVIKKAEKAGVVKIISAGLDKNSSKECIKISKKYSIVEAAAGIYPPDALFNEGFYTEKKEYIYDTLNEDIEFIKNNSKSIIAIGECGLDLHSGKDIEFQKNVFREMIKLSIELDKPIVIHSRKAEQEVLDVLKEFKELKPEKVIMHCFSGKKKLIDECIQRKYNFSIPTNIVRAENFKELVKKAPIKTLLTETDGPYLSPYKNQDKSFNRNEPSYIIETIKQISEIKKITIEDCKNQIFLNYQKIFS